MTDLLREEMVRVAQKAADENACDYEDYCSDTMTRAILSAVLPLIVEACAKVAEDEGGYPTNTESVPTDYINEGRNRAANEIAAAIRATLAPAPQVRE